MRVRYTPRARRDLEAIYRYIDQPAPQAARGVKKTIEHRIALLSEFPLVAPQTEEKGVHELHIAPYPYHVYYQVDRTEVQILHIRDERRGPWSEDH
jgi:addiction module RelE/StbE family toxin